MRPQSRRPLALSVLCGIAALLLALPGSMAGADTLRERLAARREAAGDGLVQETLTVGGTDRSWYIHVPAAADGRTGLPAVIVFHGGEGDGRDAAAVSRMAEAADVQGFVAIFPDSPGTQWNDGRAETDSGIDDTAFIRALLDDVAARHDIDRTRVFAAGISNGGIFVQRLACDAPGTLRAAAVVAAIMPADLAPACAPARPVPMIFFNGTDDRLMPFDGGEIASLRRLGIGVGGTVLSQAETRDFWADSFACTRRGDPALLPDTADDGTAVVRQDITGCRGRAELAFLIITGGGHNWPGSGMGGRFAGTVSQDIDATAEILAFFGHHGL